MSASVGDPKAAILIVGAEVLSGKVDDQNGPFLIRALRSRGIRLRELRVIDDVPETIIEAVRALRPGVDWLFTTGGIGPTHDDVTVPAVARALDRPVVRHPELLQRLVERYGDREGPHLRLAEVPEGAELVRTVDGIIPAIQCENVFIFPGVPSLMRLCFAQVESRLGAAPLFAQALYLNASESRIADVLTAAQHAHPAVAIGSYPRFDEAAYRVKVTFDGRDETDVRAARDEVRAALPAEWFVSDPTS